MRSACSLQSTALDPTHPGMTPLTLGALFSLPSASSREFFTVCPEARTLDSPSECLQVCLHGDSRFSDDGNQ